jgi:long-chain acyl-CoA synthetase
MIELLPQILIQGANAHAGRLAVQDVHGSVSYESLATQAGELAGGLRHLGLKTGDRSLVVLPNGIPFVTAHFANLLAGAVSVPFDASVAPDSFASMAANCRPRFLLTNAASAQRLAGVACETGIEKVISFDETPYALSAQEVSSVGHASVFTDQITPDSLAVLMYTTGTTGQTKGVRLTHANVMHAIRNICNFVGYGPDDREVVTLPLSHNFGLGHLYCNLLNGGAVYTESGLTRVGRVLEKVQSFEATGFPGTPSGFAMLMDRYGPILAKRGSRLRFSVINSAPLPPERTMQLQALLPDLDIMVYYGLTEASRSTFISLTRHGPDYFRSVGRALGTTQLAIKSEAGKTLESGQAGEVVIHGPTVTSGYWDNESETRLLLRDGWLHTGDLGHLDKDGYLFITGRLKDVINVGGYKVNPSEVERVLSKFPGVLDVAVAGIPEPDGEVVVAAIVADPASPPDFAAIETECLQHLERSKVPTRFFHVVKIPRTDSGKIQRSVLIKELIFKDHA